MRTRTRLFDIVGYRRRLRRFGVMREDHALPGLARIDAQHRAHGCPDIERDTTETRAKTDGVVGQLEVVSCRLTDIEDDLAVLDMLLAAR